MSADEFDEGYLPAEVESDYQTIVSSRYLESHTLSVKHLRFGGRSEYHLSRPNALLLRADTSAQGNPSRPGACPKTQRAHFEQ
jgi:hypothetical protein